MTHTAKEIEAAIKVIQSALVDRFGDNAANAGIGDGYSVEIRCTGVGIETEFNQFEVEEGTPEQAARFLMDQTD